MSAWTVISKEFVILRLELVVIKLTISTGTRIQNIMGDLIGESIISSLIVRHAILTYTFAYTTASKSSPPSTFQIFSFQNPLHL